MSALSSKGRYPVKSNQLGMRVIAFSFDPSDNSISGADKDLISVVDNATGNFTFTLSAKARSAYGNDIHIAGLVSLTEDVVANVEAVSDSVVTIQGRSNAGTPADADVACHITLFVHDWKITYN